MSKKVTALERAEKDAAKRVDATAAPSATMITLGMLIGLLGCLFSLWQLVAEGWYEAGRQGIRQSASDTAVQVASTLGEYRDAVAALAAQPDLDSAFAGAGEERLSDIEGLLRRRVPEAIRVRLVESNIEHRDPQPFPGLGYAALATLLEAKTRGELVGPAVGLARTQNSHLNWAQPVASGQGLLLVSYPMSIVGDLLDQADVGSGYLDFRTMQSGGNNLVAISRGTSERAGDLPREAVMGTRFSIGYFQAPPPGYLGNSPAVSWGLLVVCGFLLIGSAIWRFQPELIAKLLAARDKAEDQDEDLTLAEMAQADDSLKEAMQFTKDIKSVSKAKPGTVVPQAIFRAYDIRGVVGRTLSISIASEIGRAIGSEAVDRGVSQVVVARDGRVSGPDMAGALIEGLTSTGIDVIDIGAVPTGVLYFATHHLGTGSGVMVTGSHNPPDYNGFKIMLAGQTLAGEDLQVLYRRITDRQMKEGSGGVQEMDIIQEYVDRIAGDVQVEEPLKVVLDCGNGIGGRVAPLVLEEIGCEVVPLYCEVDGKFPNHHPDPSDPANLQDLIVSVEKLDADIGVALDGDGDRLGVVTREGEIIFPDRLLMLFAEDVLTRNPGAAVIYDVKCTGQLARVVLQHGGSPIMWKTGHSLIKGKMKETNAALAGEMSGHFFFQERWYGFDDGIYSCARLLEILAAEGQPPSDTLNALPNSVSTPELKLEMAEGEHFKFIQDFQSQAAFEGARITDIDGIRADYDDGWGLVRCSNTTPCLVLRFDASTQEALERIQNAFREQMLAVKPDLELPF